jgi:glycosyltransferase involved in cell wall biosynthesis/peptidoglycan/xylan/chitin deacetylase (PgdA/CDA1 family)
MPPQIPLAIFVDRYIAGGTQRQMIELLKRIDRQRFRIHPVCFHDDGPWTHRVAELGDPIARFPIHGFRRPDTARQLMAFARWCRINRIAIVHSWDIYSNAFGLPGAALARVPVRIGSRRGLGGPAGVRLLQRAAYRAAHRMVANSRAAAEQLVTEGVPEERITVISNGVDLATFPSHTYSARPRRIAMVACLREEKRIDVLIEAAPRILERHPDAEFLIVGDGRCREHLTTLARTTGVQERFRFLGHRDDVPTVLADADLFVLPSASEAFPNVILEAMAAGLPVVATRVGGIPELVEEGVTGSLVPPADSRALADALLRLLDNPDRAAALGRTGRSRIEQAYSFDRMVEQFETLYLSELEASRARHRPFTPGRVTQIPGVKRRVKNGLMKAYLASPLPDVRDRVNARLGRRRLTVLTYHQVQDPADDGSSVGTSAFREQMRFVKEHYRVVPLADAVKMLHAGGPPEKLVAITFDDGYLDNATTAAPILKELDVPATFFISTDMIGGGRPFPHDVLRGRVPQEHMSWDDVRSLAAQGFDIGSHTCSHANLGAVSLEEAEHELRLSRAHIEAELQQPVGLFSFPYGHPRNMRPDTMAAARREYDVCCSAYGGHNLSPGDPGEIRRIVVSSGVTFLAFRALIEGWPMLRIANTRTAPAAGAGAPASPEGERVGLRL